MQSVFLGLSYTFLYIFDIYYIQEKSIFRCSPRFNISHIVISWGKKMELFAAKSGRDVALGIEKERTSKRIYGILSRTLSNVGGYTL